MPRQARSRALLRAVVSTVNFGVCLLAPAGWTWRRGWVLVLTFLAIHVAGTQRIERANPGLLKERAGFPLRRGQPLVDKLLLVAFMLAYAGLLVVTSLDAARGPRWPSPPAALAWLGLALFAGGWTLVMRALETNAFAVTVVRHQTDRGHAIVDRDVYGIVRHPMYAGLVVMLPGVPLWCGSTLGLLCAAAPVGLLLLRIPLEERVLRQALPAYAAYAERVRSRIIPLVW
jgi:protein-S-isoprenylcysteine O-methyltransferase Ste14